MSGGNGYDAQGEDEALNRRLGAVEAELIPTAIAVRRFDDRLADMRDDLVSVRGELREGLARIEETLAQVVSLLGGK